MDDVKRLGTAVRKLLEYDAKIRKEKDGRAHRAAVTGPHNVVFDGKSYPAQVATDFSMKPDSHCWVQITKNGTAVVVGGASG